MPPNLQLPPESAEQQAALHNQTNPFPPSHSGNQAFNPQQPNIPPPLLAQILAQRGAFPFVGNQPFVIPIAQTQQSLRVWQGQYPPPEAVEHYERVLPGAFERIIAMTERLQAAQIEEAREIRVNTKSDSRRGHYLGFCASIFAMLCAVFCTWLGYPWVGGLFLGVPVMSIGNALINSARKEKTSDLMKAAIQSASAPETPPAS